MIKNSLIIFFTIFFTSNIFSQNLPKTFYLSKEKKLSKTAVPFEDPNPAGNNISDIIAIGDTVWLGTSRGLSLSTDRGNSWKNFFGSEDFGTESISAMGYNNGIFWAATAHSKDVEGQSLQEGSGLHYTDDKGETWTNVPQPIDDPGDSLLIYGINDGVNLPKVRALPVTVAVQNLTFDIAFTKGTIWITSFAGGLRKSTDKGATWQRVLLPSDSLNSLTPNDTVKFALQPSGGNFGPDDWLNHRVFSVISANDSTLYVGTANGINKSTDNGISWQKFNHQNQENSISGNFIVALGFNNSTNSVWAASWRAEKPDEFYAVSASFDSGKNWEIFLEDEQVHNFGFKGNDVIALSDNGAFRTDNNGSNWVLPNSIIDENTKLSLKTNIFYAASSEGNDVWLGSNDGLAKITETGNVMWDGKWKIYFASQPLTSNNDSYVFPNPFSPKIDETLKFKYSTNGNTQPVTIMIFDFAMNYVKTLIQNAERDFDKNGLEPATWDGSDANGNIVPNGVYFYRIEVGSEEPRYGKILVLR